MLPESDDAGLLLGDGLIFWGRERCTLEISNVEPLKNFTGLVRMSDVLKSLGSVLATLGHDNLVSSRMLVQELGNVVNFAVNESIEAILLGVLLELLEIDLGGHGGRRKSGWYVEDGCA